MQKRLTQKQVSLIVAEVERMSQQRESEVEVEELQQILQDLNLPEDLLDEAVMQVYRKQALDKQKQRNRLVIGGVVALMLSAALATFFVQQNWQQALARVKGDNPRIGFRRNDSVNVEEISRQKAPEVFYNVTLQDAPVGKQLELGCNWLNPSREIAHQSSWKTKTINKEVWNTYCRYQFNESVPAGKWIVQMTLGDRVIQGKEFFVK